MAKSETHDQIIETMVDYKKGLRTLETGAKVLAEQTGLENDVAKALLKVMNKSYTSVTNIRGYSKEPERLRKSKIGTPNEHKK
jgi:hypothetical protein